MFKAIAYVGLGKTETIGLFSNFIDAQMCLEQEIGRQIAYYLDKYDLTSSEIDDIKSAFFNNSLILEI